jgi:hypothetical protein
MAALSTLTVHRWVDCGCAHACNCAFGEAQPATSTPTSEQAKESSPKPWPSVIVAVSGRAYIRED